MLLFVGYADVLVVSDPLVHCTLRFLPDAITRSHQGVSASCIHHQKYTYQRS